MLVSLELIVLCEEAGEVTASGSAWLPAIGVEVEPAGRRRRLLCRPCLEWNEQQPHLARRFGAAICCRCEEFERVERRRAVRKTDDVPARFNAGEFVLPADYVRWVGERSLQRDIPKSKQERQQAGAQPRVPTPAEIRHTISQARC